MNSSNQKDRNEETREKLFRIVMRGEWKIALEICVSNPEALIIRILSSGDTVLHLAVSEGLNDNEVKKFLDVIENNNNKKEALKIQNERGNTPLHYAASAGNVFVCRAIASIDPSLVGLKNNEGETPLFLAALRDKKDAFLMLHSYDRQRLSENLRRKDGETFLHCVINRGYFDMAFQIIQQYEGLVNLVNAEGLSPLHILASKASAFESGCNLRLWENIIYKCISVNELKVDPVPRNQSSSTKSQDETRVMKPAPDNYRLFGLLRRTVLAVISKREAKDHDTENPGGNVSAPVAKEQQIYPAITGIFGIPGMITRIKELKEKHTWACQIMLELLKKAKMYDCENPGASPSMTGEDEGHGHPPTITEPREKEEEEEKTETKLLVTSINGVTKMVKRTLEDFSAYHIYDMKDLCERMKNIVLVAELKTKGEIPSKPIGKRETAILIAARNGVKEMVEAILETFPVAIHDMDREKRNIVLLAVENRKVQVYKFLLKKYKGSKDNLFGKVDINGDGVLHYAAKFGPHSSPWPVPGEALQMHCEIKWFKFVKNSLPRHLYVHYNDKGETPEDIFTESHKELINSGGKWMTTTAQSCSAVAALIAAVAFATSSQLPGNTDKYGEPNMEKHAAFKLFTISSLMALLFSVSSIVLFLAILTTRYQAIHFHKNLPRKLSMGLTSLFLSITCMLVSFCAGHFLVVKGISNIKYVAFSVYAIMFLPITFFGFFQIPLYLDLVCSIFPSSFGKQIK